MPVSRKDKKVSLTKTTKKGMKMKQQIVEEIRKQLDVFSSLYLFTVSNNRNAPLKEVREDWKGSRIFFAKRRLMALALGQSKEKEVRINLHKVSKHLVGECGLLFTNKSKEDVIQYFQTFSRLECAKSGFIPTETTILPAGPLALPAPMEPFLRTQLGLPTQLDKGKIVLREDYTVSSTGQPLTPAHAHILKLLKIEMAEFRIILVCMWSKDGSFEKFRIPEELRKEVKTNDVQKGAAGDTKTPEKIKTKSKKEEDKSNKEANLSLKSGKETPRSMKGKLNQSKSEDKSLSESSIVVESNLNNLQSNDISTKIPEEEVFSPKVGKGMPRRSMRTPKPIKRTPEQRRLSVKKLTDSSKKNLTTPKGNLKTTAKRKSLKPRNSEDVEMGE